MTLKQQVARLQRQLIEAHEQREQLDQTATAAMAAWEARVAETMAEVHRRGVRIDELEREVTRECRMRLDAQAGVLPYVQALEAFNEWVERWPNEAGAELRLALRRFGLLDIKVGYEPPHELNWFESLPVTMG